MASDVKGEARLAVGKEGLRAIAFRIQTKDEKGIRYTTGKADAQGRVTQWAPPEAVTTGGAETALALDGHDQAHLVYRRAPCTGPACQTKLEYRALTQKDGATAVEIIEEKVGLSGDLCLSLDDQQRAHIAYFDAQARDLKYALREAQGWRVAVAAPAVDQGKRPSLPTAMALDGKGVPHLAFASQDGAAAQPVGPLSYATVVDGKWQIEPLTEAKQAFQVALAWAEDQPLVAYCSDWKHPQIWLATRSANGWSHQVVADGKDATVPKCRKQLSLARAPSGKLHLVYGSGATVRHIFRDGDRWQNEHVDEGTGPALALDTAGNPFVVYRSPKLRAPQLFYGARTGK